MRGKIPDINASDPDDQVRLKPVMGIRPGVLIAAALLAVLLLFFYLILLRPGIVRPGSVIVFTSDPSGAALRVDDLYAGSSPCKVFVPKGNRILEVVLPGFNSERIECLVQGRLFASSLFPALLPLNVKLTTDDPAAALALSASDFAAWSFGGEPTAAWQVPLSLSEGVYRIGQAASSPEANGIIAASARFGVTRAALRDLVRAKTLACGCGLPPSPPTLIRSVSDIISFLSENPNSAAWLAETLPSDSVNALISSAWYQNQLASFAEITMGEILSAPPAEAVRQASGPPFEQVRVGGLLFTGMGSGNLAQGEPFPHHVPIEPFMICVSVIPVPAWEDFLDATPLWRPDQREALEERGLVDSEYLAEFGGISVGRGRTGIDGINAVSWYAAQAFCQWLSGKLPASLSDWEVRLPTEAEWEYAAKSARAWRGYILAFEGRVWEWCADPYSPLPFHAAPREAVSAVGSPERPLRGGSWLNATGSTSPETRAFLPPATCSPFVSFRPVIARKP